METWKPIKDYESIYEVSNKGNVKSLPRLKPVNYHKDVYYKTKERILTPVNKDGYLVVRLYKNGVWKRFRIHRLVAEAFIDNPKGHKEINHKDFNKRNNIVENLEWCDRFHNATHSAYGGRSCKLSLKDAQEIRERSFLSLRLLSMFYGVTRAEITNILKFKVFNKLNK